MAKLIKHAMLIVLGMILAITGIGAAVAQDAPFMVANSRSPDGKTEIWIEPIRSEGIAMGTAQIRSVKSQKILSTFEWSGFGDHLSSDNPDPAFTVFWRPDCKFFAIKYEETRGWMTGQIFGVHKNGQWTEVGLPKDDYDDAIKKLAGVSEFYGKGCDVPERWLSNGDLNLDFADRNIIYDHEDMFKEYTVTLGVADQKGQPLLMAKIVSVKQKPEAETERELQAQ